MTRLTLTNENLNKTLIFSPVTYIYITYQSAGFIICWKVHILYEQLLLHFAKNTKGWNWLQSILIERFKQFWFFRLQLTMILGQFNAFVST